VAGPASANGFACPKCDARTNVKDSRQDVDGSVRRRRECSQCSHRFTTYEEVSGRLEKASDRERLRLYERLFPKLVALANDIDLLTAEHD
jgi:transcriptional regulator NrdR family protein